MAKPALGKGLGALINTRVAAPAPHEELGERVQLLPLGQIVASPFQPRQEFRDEHLTELVESIRERGIIQPLIVRKVGDHHELIAGERRWRAAKQLGLPEAPVILREASDREVLELALIENLQREDLNPIEAANAYGRLHKDFGLTQEEIARKVGKSREVVANALRLLTLDPEVKGYVKTGHLSVGHAKVLLSVKDAESQRALAAEVIRRSLSVRASEAVVSKHLGKAAPATPGTSAPRRGVSEHLVPALQSVENQLRHRLGTHVVLHHGEKKGTIEIEYYGKDDLNRILEELGIKEA